MKVGELIAALQRVGNDGALVMGIEVQTSSLRTVERVRIERHDDADGSTTVWLDLEDY